MRDHRFVTVVLMLLLSPAATGRALAQVQGAGAPQKKGTGDRSDRRLFERFVEDAAISTGGWVELQYRYDNMSTGSRHLLGPVVVFKIVNDVEGGLRFGWQDVNPDAGPNESGLSDIDLYAKYRFPGGRARTAVGVLLKLPTADEGKGLGTGEKDAEVFAAWRADLEAVSITVNGGFRFNGNPPSSLPQTDDSFQLGGAIILPATTRLTFLIETTYETRRLEGGDYDARLILGFQRRSSKGRGGYRGAVGVPLSDGAPDYQLFAGAFMTY